LYNGDGTTTSFSSVFTFWDADDPKVVLVSSSGGETTYTRGTEYTITGGGGATGSIVVSSSIPPSAQEQLLVISNVPLLQETDLAEGGAFATQDVEDELDRTVRRVQQQGEKLDRAPLLTEASTYTGLVVPDPVADRVLGWDSSADGTLVNIVRNSSEFLSTPISLAAGGTASTSSSAALTTLGGQPLDTDLTTIAALTHSSSLVGAALLSDGSSWVSLNFSSSQVDFAPVSDGSSFIATGILKQGTHTF